jgi:hypothetical protein
MDPVPSPPVDVKQQMSTLVTVVRDLRHDIQRAWVNALRRMGYPVMGNNPSASALGAAAAATPGGVQNHQMHRDPDLRNKYTERILENFRNHDAHVLADGFFHFMEHDHHKGRLKDAIHEVVETRVFKLGFEKHNVLSAIMLFPTVVLSVCRDLSPDNQITLVEAPRVAVDCFQEVVALLNEKQLLGVDADSALCEMTPSPLLSAFLSDTNIAQVRVVPAAPTPAPASSAAGAGAGFAGAAAAPGGAVGGARDVPPPPQTNAMLLLWCQDRMAASDSALPPQNGSVGGTGGTTDSAFASSAAAASGSVGSDGSVGPGGLSRHQQQHQPNPGTVPRHLSPLIGATVNDRYIIKE